MTGLEYVLAAVFAAVWAVPLSMAVRWERRLRRSAPAPVRRPGRAAADALAGTERP